MPRRTKKDMDREISDLRAQNTVLLEQAATKDRIIEKLLDERPLDLSKYSRQQVVNIYVDTLKLGGIHSESNDMTQIKKDGDITFTNSPVLAGSIGHGSAAAVGTQTQQTAQTAARPDMSAADLETFSKQLAALIVALLMQGTEPEHDEAVAALGKAKKAAEQNDQKGVWSHLTNAAKLGGTWLYDVSTKIAGDLVKEALKSVAGA